MMANEVQANTTVLIGIEVDKPLMTVRPLSCIPAGAKSIELSSTGIDRLSPLLQALPGALAAKEMAGSRFMQVVIDGPLTQAADGHGWRAFSRLNGKITEHARLFDPQQLQQLVNSAAMFQIASAVVAQKHLADISAKLDEIKAGVDRIARFLEVQRKSKITGSLKYLAQIAATLSDCKEDHAVRAQLESIERELGSIHDHLNDEFSQLADHVKTLEAPGLFGTSADLTGKLKDAQAKVDPKVEEWKLCMSGRWIACSLLAQIAGRTSLVIQREQALRNETHAFLADDGPLGAFKTTMAERIQNLSALRDSRTTLQINRIALRKWENDTLPGLQSTTRRDIGQAQALLLEREKKVTLTVEMREGQCVAAYQL